MSKGNGCSMTEIVCTMFVYQSADVVLEALKSIDGKVDRIICFDGRWHGYTGPDHSTDETQKIILEFSMSSKSQVYYITLPVLHQWQARTLALQYLQNDDWAVTIDADEVVIEWDYNVRATLENSTPDNKAYRVCWVLYKPYAGVPTPRCVRKTETLHWAKNHRQLLDKDGEIDLIHAPVIHIVINHQPLADKKKMRQQANIYKKWLREWENQHEDEIC